MIVDTNDLDQAFDAYKNGKIMRKDMLRHICDHLIAIEKQWTSLTATELSRETAQVELRQSVKAIGERLDRLDDDIDTKIATAANSAIAIWRGMNGEGAAPKTTPARRGRPPKQPQAEVGG